MLRELEMFLGLKKRLIEFDAVEKGNRRLWILTHTNKSKVRKLCRPRTLTSLGLQVISWYFAVRRGQRPEPTHFMRGSQHMAIA